MMNFSERDKRYDTAWFLFLILLALKTLLIWNRYFPNIFFDEGVYLFKARNFAHFLSYFTPPGIGDIENVYSPLYSLVLSPIFVFFGSPEMTYKLALFLNAILTSAIVFPLYFFAADFYPEYKIWIVSAAATLPSCFGYAFSAMSEALFIPLFVFTLYYYYKRWASGRRRYHILFWVTWGLLLMTRNAAIVLIPAYIMILLLNLYIDRHRPFRARAFLLDIFALILTSLPYLIWSGILRSRHAASQKISTYVDQGILNIFESFQSVMTYADTWIGQLGYIGLSTYTMGVFILFFTSARTGKERAIKSNQQRLLFLLFSLTLFLIGASTVHMFRAGLTDDASRYHMYGRYVDMLVPVIFLFGAGTFFEMDIKNYFRTHKRKACIFIAAILVFFAMIIINIPEKIGTVRVFNMGVAGVDKLVRNFEKGRIVIFFLMAGIAGTAFLGKKYRIVIVSMIILVFNAYSITKVHQKVLVYEEKNGKQAGLMKNIRAHKESKIWIYTEDLQKKMFWSVKYYFHTKAYTYRRFEDLNMKNDYLVWGDKILKLSECEHQFKSHLKNNVKKTKNKKIKRVLKK